MTPLVEELLRRHREHLIQADHDSRFRLTILWLLVGLTSAFLAVSVYTRHL